MQDIAEILNDLIQESPELYLDEIGLWLAVYHEVQISTSALHKLQQSQGAGTNTQAHAPCSSQARS